METFVIITTLISVLLNAGVSLKSLHLSWKNQQTRDAVMSVVNATTNALKSGRLKLSNIISALTNNNSAALQQLLYNNPLVSKTLDEINADSQIISEIQNKANFYENLINSLEAQLQSLGFSQSHSGIRTESDKRASLTAQLDEARRGYDKVVKQAGDVKLSPTRAFKVDTSHLDAISQNINGGLK